MFTILGWITATAFDSFATSHYKRALNLWKNIPNSVFKTITYVLNFFTFCLCALYFGFQSDIFTNYPILFAIMWLAVLKNAYTLLGLHIYKTTKLSELLPYWNIDKIFIIIFWFFLYQWIEWKETSVPTLVIIFLTICIIAIFTIDFKNIKIPKTIALYILQRFFSALLGILTWYILLSYQPITFWITNTIFEWLFILMFIWYSKDSLRPLIRQSKIFYKHRILSTALWQVHMILSLFIIESAWIIIASLLWFVSIAFNIISMKITLNDSPSKKQIILAFIVIGMIWLGYYFK